ncbi:MAG: AI-2E family transporter [Chroococcales cyanobacterium]
MIEPDLNKFFQKISNTQLVRYLLFFALGWAIVQVLAYFQAVIIVFTFAAILTFLLNYPVRSLKRFLPHSLAVSLVFLLFLFVIIGLTFTIGFAILSQAQDFLNQAPKIVNDLSAKIQELEAILERFRIPVNLEVLAEEIRNIGLSQIGAGLTTIQGLLANFVTFIFIAVVAFFMLLNGQPIWQFVIQWFPYPFQEELTLSLKRNFLGFFWGRFLLSVFFAVSTCFVYFILQTPYPLVLSVIAGIFDLIPGIGATLGISIIALILLPQGIWLSVKVVILSILLQQVEENLLMPKIMQDSVNLNPVVLFFALLVGARIAGLLGIFLAIPIAGVIISLLGIEEMKG